MIHVPGAEIDDGNNGDGEDVLPEEMQEGEGGEGGQDILIAPVLRWIGKQGRWYALLIFVLGLAALYLFGVPLGAAWEALTK